MMIMTMLMTMIIYIWKTMFAARKGKTLAKFSISLFQFLMKDRKLRVASRCDRSLLAPREPLVPRPGRVQLSVAPGKLHRTQRLSSASLELPWGSKLATHVASANLEWGSCNGSR